MKLTADLHLVPMLSMSGVIRLLQLYAFMTWTDTTLPYSVLLDNVYFTLINVR